MCSIFVIDLFTAKVRAICRDFDGQFRANIWTHFCRNFLAGISKFQHKFLSWFVFDFIFGIFTDDK